MLSRLVVVVVLASVMFGCGGGPTPSPTPSAGVVAVIVDGDSPGTFVSPEQEPDDCSYAAYVPDMWIADYTNFQSSEKGILQASMWDQPDENNPGSRLINVLVSVGTGSNHKNYEVIAGADDPPIEHSIVEANGGAIFHAHFTSTVVAPTGDVPGVEVDVTFRCAVVEGR